eukprot:scaffold13268_cov135-Cylindrotheca_fusiformis.AAC.1
MTTSGQGTGWRTSLFSILAHAKWCFWVIGIVGIDADIMTVVSNSDANVGGVAFFNHTPIRSITSWEKHYYCLAD